MRRCGWCDVAWQCMCRQAGADALLQWCHDSDTLAPGQFPQAGTCAGSPAHTTPQDVSACDEHVLAGEHNLPSQVLLRLAQTRRPAEGASAHDSLVRACSCRCPPTSVSWWLRLAPDQAQGLLRVGGRSICQLTACAGRQVQMPYLNSTPEQLS